MKEKLRAFFSGRNGFDQLGRALIWPALIGLLLSSLVPVEWLRTVLYYLSLALLCYVYVRAFSRNVERCSAQNQRYLSWRRCRKLAFQQRKTHRFYRCPQCRQRLRVPRGKGKIRITCGKCGALFEKTT